MSDGRRRALLIDAGNTRVKWGVVEGGTLRRTGSIGHDRLADTGFAALTTRLPHELDAVLVSNVAGASFATRLSGVLGIHCGCDVHFAHTERQAYGVSNSYRQPRRMGVDRWVAMIGGYNEFKAPLCIVDAGTAVTIDALDRTGQHLGGQILPGIALMMEALSTDTSDIPAVKRVPSSSSDGLDVFANSTRGAVYNGAIAAVCGAIERAVRTLRSARYRPKVVLTGGDASRILSRLEGTVEHRPNLVLQGLQIMLQGT
jgi:type III pantothenate kinase